MARVAVITGAARGIGAAAVRKFVSHEYQVIGVDVLRPEMVDPEEVSGAKQQFVHCDVSDEQAVAAMVRAVMARHGRIDVLVNIAGVVLVKSLEETSWDEFQRVVNINLGGIFLLCKHVLPIMKQQRQGVIVNLGSVAGHVGQVDHAVYGASKAAVIAIGRALAWEVAPYHIRVNSVSPGSVDTPMLRSDIEIEAMKTGASYDAVKARREAEQALGRWADPVEIASAVYFMASDEASFITGTDLLVDCGWAAR